MNSYNKKTIEKLKKRYSHDNKTIGHHGDCGFYSIVGICDCGLFHDLIYIGYEVPKELYPNFDKDMEKERELKYKYEMIEHLNISLKQIQDLELPLIDFIGITDYNISILVIPPDWLSKQEKISISYDKEKTLDGQFLDYFNLKCKIDEIGKREYSKLKSKSVSNISHIVHRGGNQYTLCYDFNKVVEKIDNETFKTLKEIAKKTIVDIFRKGVNS